MKAKLEYEGKHLLILAESEAEYRAIEKWFKNFMAMKKRYSISYVMAEHVVIESHLELYKKLEQAEAELALLRNAFNAARNYIDANVCDPDINAEMIEAWNKYQKAVTALRAADEKSPCNY